MEIVWYGLSCFRITERNRATIVTDPTGDNLGYPPRKLDADVVTISHPASGHNNLNIVRNVPPNHVITSPGEYEIGNVFIVGINPADKKRRESGDRNVIYLYDYENITVAHLGDLSFVPSQTAIEALSSVDVALVPVGGGGGLTAAQAAEVVNLLEPGIVIPMHYHTPELTGITLDPLEKFLNEMGVTHAEAIESLKISGHTTAEESTKVVVLAPKT